MTNEIDQLIWRVLDGKASEGEIRELKGWIEEKESNREYFRQWKKIWNMTNGPTLSVSRKQREKERFLKSIHQSYAGKVRKRRIIHYWPVAASVVLLVGVFVGFALNEWSQMKADQGIAQTERIVPGVKAELILSTGERVCLAQRSEFIEGMKESGIRNDSLAGLNYVGAKIQGKEIGEEIVYNTMQIPVGGFYQLKLADGTKVWLNSLTQLRFPVTFAGEERKVYLTGEAYFEVARDSVHPFIVATDEGMEVKVYGTEFNVDTYRKGTVKTTLVNGKVGIRVSATGEEVRLSPNQMALFTKATQSIQVENVDPYGAVAWKDGKFVFEDEPMEEIMERLSRWYDVKVFYANERIKKHTFTGIITRFADISDVLHLMEETAAVEFNIQGNIVTVK
ncbi:MULTISPECIES: FecR family protein [Butyricimonas]|uniref:FecR family protein n=1 Tax=Butyricimonas TaxID=574697 RepID=UPI0020849BD1|nr:FecR domain-containing protein [Butyricimonas paravirosa]BDF52603.1 iron dicitrate transporter FecR [Odoribacteraceae bacterium]GKH91542.1 iron dicitrate transporter FecR [Odoribacteraceae bacterium]GKH96160.1 iron dicitrate transporter FecR [Odoribacteraceae bacterium]GKI03038.1 iron dicitrate transporter FecR [Odoribacteraceae bacterium]